MALRLHAIIFLEGHGESPVAPGSSVVTLRELGAVVEEAPYELATADEALLERHREIVDAAFRRGAVLPVPVGTVFRNGQALMQWLELHYVALSDALSFVDDRAQARVYVGRAGKAGARDENGASADLAAIAAESFRVLRRQAVASVGLNRAQPGDDVEAAPEPAAAFLVERELWKEFTRVVEEEQERNPALSIELTGPWAPYDFVRMQFGG